MHEYGTGIRNGGGMRELVGSIVEPVGSFVEPVGSIVDTVGSIVDTVGSIVEPVGSIVDPTRYVAGWDGLTHGQLKTVPVDRSSTSHVLGETVGAPLAPGPPPVPPLPSR